MSYLRYQDDPLGLWRFMVRQKLDGSPALAADPLGYRQHDWPFPGFAPLGQETCDSVLSPDGYSAWEYESFPPWLPPYTAQGGNGGDITVVTSDGWVKVVATMDGGHPGELYYFVGPGVGQAGDDRQGGWVVAGPDVQVDAWSSVICWLQQSPNTPYDPVGSLSPSYTRYLRNAISVPFLSDGDTEHLVSLETLVSEHYETDYPQGSTEMERFFYSVGYGKVRWEFWSSVASVSPYVVERAPPISYGYPSSTPLNPSMRLCDVRHYANIVAQPDGSGGAKGIYGLPPMLVPGTTVVPGLSIADFGWPPNFVLP